MSRYTVITEGDNIPFSVLCDTRKVRFESERETMRDYSVSQLTTKLKVC